MNRIEQKKSIITAAAQEIGNSIARALAEEVAMSL
tara:strand:+ start:69068 stop:69172 length:105 start_codon:yes stop_codon:yes gene_type:complete